ncbi:MAG TPA: cysteine dioxygenase family protein [Pyrinomonadaceae bacterium]|nr:cysteine dioxygenase family protein [Pyrinomonadaceae bacterium]
MSTDIQIPGEVRTEQNGSDTLPFAILVEQLMSQTDTPSLEQIYDWLNRANISEADLAPFVGFKDGNYWRHRVCRNEFVEMLVLCWRPGHRTPIHDHNGSHGGVRVHEGPLWETIFVYDEEKGLRYKSARAYAAGAVTGSDTPDIHQLGNPDISESDLITIHVYAPPLGVLHTYKPGSTEIELYVPDDAAA